MYIALWGGSYGQGNTLTKAYDDLQENACEIMPVDEIIFYEGKEIKVVQEVKAVPVTTVKKAATTKKGNI